MVTRSQASIDPSSMEACVTLLKQSLVPLTTGEISAEALGKKRDSKFNARLSKELSRLPASSGISEWPKFGSSRIYCARPFSACVEEAWMEALHEKPLTAPKAAQLIAKKLRRLSEAAALKQIKAVTPALVSAKRILSLQVSRQSPICVSTAWLSGLLPTPAEASPLPGAILEGVRQLQSGMGNYVRIDSLRNLPLIRRTLDTAVIGLADAGKLVLARYDGPRPVPDDEKANYVEDNSGDLFIGVALPRTAGASV